MDTAPPEASLPVHRVTVLLDCGRGGSFEQALSSIVETSLESAVEATAIEKHAPGADIRSLSPEQADLVRRDVDAAMRERAADPTGILMRNLRLEAGHASRRAALASADRVEPAVTVGIVARSVAPADRLELVRTAADLMLRSIQDPAFHRRLDRASRERIAEAHGVEMRAQVRITMDCRGSEEGASFLLESLKREAGEMGRVLEDGMQLLGGRPPLPEEPASSRFGA